MPELELLEQDPALPLDDRLRQPGRPRRVEHPQRVVERDRLERERVVAEEAVLPAAAVEVAEPHDRRADLLADRRDRRAAVEVLAAVAVAVDREQHLRLDLGEAVDDAARAELRRGRRPHRAERRRGQERRERLRDVRQVRRDAVAAPDAAGGEPGADRRRLRPQPSPGPLAQLAQLRRVEERDAVVRLAAEQPLGVVERRAREPHGAGHRRVRQDRAVVAELAVALPDQPPEPVEVLHRPAPEGGVVLRPAIGHQPRHRGSLGPLGRRLPQQLAVRHRADPRRARSRGASTPAGAGARRRARSGG